MEGNAVKVLIVDDHAVVRKGLRYILRTGPGVFEIGEAADGDEAIMQLRCGPWDLILLDMNMPGQSGLEVLKQIKAEQPGARVLVVSMFREDYCGLRVLKAGAFGYLNKSCTPDQLVSAVVQVARGGKYITPGLAERLTNMFDSGRDDALHELLTDREFQIFNLLGAGRTVSEIAAELGLSVKTISTHRARILSKMRLRGNAELVQYFVQHGYEGFLSTGRCL